MEFAPIAKEVKCPGLAVDHRAPEEKRRKMQRHLGASGASESFADTAESEGHEARTPCPFVFLKFEQDPSTLLQMDVVRAAEDRASQRIILLGKSHTDLVESWSSAQR